VLAYTFFALDGGPDVLPVMIEYMRGLEDGGGQVWADQRLEDEKCVQTHTEEEWGEGGRGPRVSSRMYTVRSELSSLVGGLLLARLLL
jgi:hypothetical protein